MAGEAPLAIHEAQSEGTSTRWAVGATRAGSTALIQPLPVSNEAVLHDVLGVRRVPDDGQGYDVRGPEVHADDLLERVPVSAAGSVECSSMDGSHTSTGQPRGTGCDRVGGAVEHPEWFAVRDNPGRCGG